MMVVLLQDPERLETGAGRRASARPSFQGTGPVRFRGEKEGRAS